MMIKMPVQPSTLQFVVIFRYKYANEYPTMRNVSENAINKRIFQMQIPCECDRQILRICEYQMN